jgi:acyl-CoA synthetase (AMP-forming)/AMP-acid ligase II
VTAPDKPWLIDGRTGRLVTYAELIGRINQRPAALRALCQPGTTRDALQEITAAVAFGAHLTLFDSDFSERELAALGYGKEQLNLPEPVLAAASIELLMLQALAAGGSAARLGLFTSGSTGLPKLVWQSAANLARAVKVSPRQAEAIWAFAYNPTHIAGIQVYLQALANGCPLVNIYGLDRAAVLAAIERHAVTHLSATPSFYRLLLPAERRLPGVRSVTLGGESSEAGLVERLRGLFPNARFHNVYASTEAGTLLIADGDVFAIAPGLEGKVVLRGAGIHVHRSLLGEFDSNAQMREGGGQKTEGSGKLTANEEWYDTGDGVEVVSEAPLRFRIVARAQLGECRRQQGEPAGS